MQLCRLAFVHATHVPLLARPQRSCARRHTSLPGSPSRPLFAVVTAQNPPPDARPPDRQSPRRARASPSASPTSSTLIGRVLVEILSLLFGALLLLVVLAWRMSQLVSLNFFRIFAWLSNVRLLGKWAFSRLARVDRISLPVMSLAHTLRRVFRHALSRPPLSNSHPGSAASTADVPLHTADQSPNVHHNAADSVPVRAPDVSDLPVHNVPIATGRRLVLLRHAKTLWDRDIDTADHERVLSDRGKEEAHIVGSELSRLQWLPNVVLCSDAARTVQTLGMLNIPEPFARNTTCTDLLYYAVTGDEMVMAVDDTLADIGFHDHTTVMVVCHNPGCEELVEQLTGERPEMGTSCAALLEYDASHDPNSQRDNSNPLMGSHFVLSGLQKRWNLVQLLRPSSIMATKSWAAEQ